MRHSSNQFLIPAKATIALVIMIMANLACNTPECTTQFRDNMNVSFRQLGNLNQEGIPLDTNIVFSRVLIEGAGTPVIDDVENENEEEEDTPTVGLNNLQLPFDPTDTTITFIFERPRQNNFIRFKYDVFQRFNEPECGVQFLFRNLEIQDHNFDSLRLNFRSIRITNNAPELEIFF
ncbi:MAG: hypothetical protein LAT68_05245 [Cyclobacteriaceae bacterium]|nr:hypothetical protein [Cyclobacteriaceae bacterium]MCH8515715.1 hypothetical protein [Cyclobacteriaceae bacterium]